MFVTVFLRYEFPKVPKMQTQHRHSNTQQCHDLDFRVLDTTSRQVAGHTYMCGCKLDGLGFSYTGLVNCTFLTVLYLLFQRQIMEHVYDDRT